MSVSVTNSVDSYSPARRLAPLCAGAGAYLLLLFSGDMLLQDSDTFWQIKVGQWIIDHHAVPYSDFYSLIRFGTPWISNAWLSQVLYAAAYSHWGWAGPVILTSLAAATAVAIFVWLLDAYLEPAHSILMAMLALMLSWHHLLARPHVLALPVMVAWVGAMISAADRRAYPSFFLLPLIALWANLHGGFVLGLALIAPIALEAVWSAAPERRIVLGARWTIFAVGALAASCCTPYGWNTLLAAARILDLGEVLSVISEWRPTDFSSFGFFEVCLLGLMGLAFHRGAVLSFPRIVLLLLLVHAALTHVRNIESFAFLVPLVLAKPLASRGKPTDVVTQRAGELWSLPYIPSLTMVVIAAGVWTSTLSYTAHHDFVFVNSQTPASAVEVLKQHQAKRVFNSYEFGGYLIARDIPPFIDGRAELYGEKFVLDYFNAVEGRKVDQLLRLLEDSQIDATLLVPASPAAQLLDHLPGWKRLYADDTAVIHVRADRTQMNAAPTSEIPN
ncbi:MAG: hypothetical protein JWP25_2632 [Bradyrhizobium sp.]|jgi:hypothetical protein|nr:hypothetical protein [Bradyrhizobium sp.]MEA2867001.1 hypothetical protein [Bradyrhizobium sp.]